MDFQDFLNFLMYQQYMSQQETAQTVTPIHITGSINTDDNKIFFNEMCDVRTSGMNRFGSAELQMVLDIPDEEKQSIFSWLVNEIANNRIVVFDGVEVYTNVAGSYVRLNLVEDFDGNKLWRIILPDPDGRMPEDSLIAPYSFQMCSPYLSEYEPPQ